MKLTHDQKLELLQVSNTAYHTAEASNRGPGVHTHRSLSALEATLAAYDGMREAAPPVPPSLPERAKEASDFISSLAPFLDKSLREKAAAVCERLNWIVKERKEVPF